MDALGRAISVTQEARGRIVGDGVHLAYAYWPGTGDPIVAVHGASANALFYVGVAARLDGRRPLLSLDLRGRGDADKPGEGPYGIDQHAADVARSMEAWGIDRAVVIGHSLGAFVARALAADHPDLCAGLVLYDGGQVPGNKLADQSAVQEFLESSRAIEWRMHTTFASRQAYHDYWRGLGVFTTEQWGPWVDAYVDYDLGGSAPEFRAKCSLEAIGADIQDLLSTAATRDAAPIKAPAFAIIADNGLATGTRPLITDQGVEELAGQFQSFRSERLPDTNHYTIALAEPAATTVADHLVAFAAECGV